MSMLVLGGGLQGSACAYDLLRYTDYPVTLADARTDRLAEFLKPFLGERLEFVAVDATDQKPMLDLLSRHKAAMSALPYYLNADLASWAVEAGVHFADLGGNTEIVRRQKELDGAAKEKNISIMPDCGLAPGMVNILAFEGIRRIDKVESVKLYVGGLPQDPEPPLNYQIVYSLEGVLDYYTTPSFVLRNGKVSEVEALSELELMEFAGLGELEAFHTAGGVSTMPWSFEGSVPVMEYKTLRYPGHAEIMKAIRGLDLLSLDPVEVKGVQVVPRELFITLADPKLRKSDGRDLVALRVIVAGTHYGKPARVVFDLVDYYDESRGISAMMRTTGYSLSISGQLQAAGEVQAGVMTAYEGTPFVEYTGRLRERGVDIREIENVK